MEELKAKAPLSKPSHFNCLNLVTGSVDIDIDPRWSEVFELFKMQHIRHVDIRNNTLNMLQLLKDHPLHYVGESLTNTLIIKAPQWSSNQGEYQDALLWEDIIYTNEESLVISNKGNTLTGVYSLGKWGHVITLCC